MANDAKTKMILAIVIVILVILVFVRFMKSKAKPAGCDSTSATTSVGGEMKTAPEACALLTGTWDTASNKCIHSIPGIDTACPEKTNTITRETCKIMGGTWNDACAVCSGLAFDENGDLSLAANKDPTVAMGQVMALYQAECPSLMSG
jgi:hypothetical protein